MPSQYAQTIAKMDRKLDILTEQVAQLRTLVETEADRCPYREDIARASNNIKRVEEIENKVEQNSLNIAKLIGSGLAGGGIVALAQLLIDLLNR